MLTKSQFADFDADALFTEYADGTTTKSRVGWDGYFREVEIDPSYYPAVQRLLEQARDGQTGAAWGFRFVAVLAGTTYRAES
jgi:hypothetical protein